MSEHTSPAEELREAARLMRERATAATEGPWTAWVMGSEGYLVLRATGTIHERGRNRVARVGLKDWDSDKADAEYIAGMHPGVALALADWLDDRAEMADGVLYLDTPEGLCCEAPSTCRGHEPEWFCGLCGHAVDGECACGWKQNLAVARAYLGTGEQR